MKRFKLLVGFVMALVILGAVNAPTVSAQPLNGWLKCTVEAKGFNFNKDTGDIKKQNISFPAYLNFAWNATNSNYDVAVYTKADGKWAHTSDTVAKPAYEGTNIFTDFGVDFYLSLVGPDFIRTYQAPVIKISNNGKVSFKGTGMVDFGTVAGNTLFYYGYFNMHGASVPDYKLPF